MTFDGSKPLAQAEIEAIVDNLSDFEQDEKSDTSAVDSISVIHYASWRWKPVKVVLKKFYIYMYKLIPQKGHQYLTESPSEKITVETFSHCWWENAWKCKVWYLSFDLLFKDF